MNGRKFLFEMIKPGCDTLQIPKSKDRKGQSFKKKTAHKRKVCILRSVAAYLLGRKCRDTEPAE